MKNINLHFLTFLLFLFICHKAFAQPTIQWQRTLGGGYADDARSIQPTTDRGYVVAGGSLSNNGDVSGNKGNKDYWIVKLDSAGTLQWQKSFGGTGDDWAFTILQTADDKYVVAGESNSTNGDITGNHGGFDYWVVKLDNTGNLLWQVSLGGTDDDRARDIVQTKDGGYIVAGASQSTNGNVTGNHGSKDCWVVKLDNTGNLQWQKSLGGSGEDWAGGIQQTNDGGYIVGGSSPSNNGDVTGNHGGSDFWVVKLSSTGSIQWQKSLGGSGDDIGNKVIQTIDGGYIIEGTTKSSDGDVIGYHGYLDYWIVKLESNGDLQWQRTLGGTFDDWPLSIIQTTSNGYVLAGYTESNNGDVIGNYGGADYWIVQLCSNGSIQWQKTFGGSNKEHARSVQSTEDGGYIVAGFSQSNDGDVTGNHGNGDYWIVKLRGTTGINETNILSNKFSIYPNPASNMINIHLKQDLAGSAYIITDLVGKTLITGKVIEENFVIDISGLSGGLYLLRVGDDKRQAVKVIIE